ncbi:MAG: ShlB/FhaC/HecB family hemolysin secretion/activation protein [Proteobacteria bacterium]|nr:ShlB/FhaC/HecB family hemolysin secretion/activation protein [Pseudomonadota bacterium]
MRAGVVAAAVAAAAPAIAQVPRPPPDLPAGGIPLGSPLPGVVPPQQPNVAPGLPKGQPLPPLPAEGGERFAIDTVSVAGATAYPASRLAALTQGLTGSAVSEVRIEAARRAIVDLYRGDGYDFTTVRAVIAGRALRFEVIEGYIAEVKLGNDVGPVGTQVLRFLNNLVGKKPLDAATLERWLLLASDIPGLTVRSHLDPSAGEPGALTLVAQVTRKTVSGYLAADNRAAPFNGPGQGIAILNLNSLTEFGEQTQASFYGAPGPNIFGQMSEELFLGGSGLKLRVYAGAGPAYPTGQLHQIDYNNMTKVFGAQLSYPVIRVREQTLSATLAFDAIETETSTNLGADGSGTRASYDSLRIVRAGANYALLDTWLGAERSATNQFSVLFSQGLIGLGSGRDGDISTPPARIGEKVDFTKVSGQIWRTQTLFQPYADATVALQGSMAWQATGNVLPPVEKFYLGGPHFNRGYYYGQVSGDQAVSASAELQLNTPIPLPSPLTAKLPVTLQSQFYTFYNWGQAWQNDPQVESDVMLQSAGGGVRMFFNDAVELDLEGVYRGNQYPNGRGPGVSALRTAAFYWQLSVRF